MNDNELAVPSPEPVPSEPVIALPPDVDPTPAPEPTTPPMEVISVDELLDRLTEEEPGELVPEDPDIAAVDLPVEPDPILALLETLGGHLLDMITQQAKLEAIAKDIEEDTDIIQQETVTIARTLDHPALTTSFRDYTVTEGLLLLLLLSAFIAACARMLRGGLSWLRS